MQTERGIPKLYSLVGLRFEITKQGECRMRIAIIGAGSVGTALGQAWLKHGEDVTWAQHIECRCIIRMISAEPRLHRDLKFLRQHKRFFFITRERKITDPPALTRDAATLVGRTMASTGAARKLISRPHSAEGVCVALAVTMRALTGCATRSTGRSALGERYYFRLMAPPPHCRGVLPCAQPSCVLRFQPEPSREVAYHLHRSCTRLWQCNVTVS